MPTSETGIPDPMEPDRTAVRVFMSYRRSDDVNFNGRFHDRLVSEFGDDHVFRDIDSIPPGTVFAELIVDRLRDIDAVVAMIGPSWAERLSSPDDFVRMELVEALQSDRPVIPVLIEDTPIPDRSILPEELHRLLSLNAVRVRRDPDFHRDVGHAIEGIHTAVHAARQRTIEQRRTDEQRRRAALARQEELALQLDAARRLEEESRQTAVLLKRERDDRQAALDRIEEELTERRVAAERLRLDSIDDELLKGAEVSRQAAEKVAALQLELDETRDESAPARPLLNLSSSTEPPVRSTAPDPETDVAPASDNFPADAEWDRASNEDTMDQGSGADSRSLRGLRPAIAGASFVSFVVLAFLYLLNLSNAGDHPVGNAVCVVSLAAMVWVIVAASRRIAASARSTADRRRDLRLLLVGCCVSALGAIVWLGVFRSINVPVEQEVVGPVVGIIWLLASSAAIAILLLRKRSLSSS